VSDYRVTCVVEIPKGSRNKDEYDSKLGAIKLDRFISASVVYPTDYGYLPETLAPDGDALDVLVCVSEPTFPGCYVLAKAVAGGVARPAVVDVAAERCAPAVVVAMPGGGGRAGARARRGSEVEVAGPSAHHA
jgi:Inorganic pyrophosphatase